MFGHGEVPELFYDENDYPVDKDHNGKVWRLTSNADHLTRSKVLYHPTVIQKKTEDILICAQARHRHDFRLITESNLTIETNKNAALKLKEMVNAVTEVSHLEEKNVRVCNFRDV